jgi:hypothetical protein
MKRNLVISSVGDNSLHERWTTSCRDFDIFIIYYGNNDDIFERYGNGCDLIVRDKGEKGKLYYRFIKSVLDKINNYEIIWMPDDDLEIDTESINLLFKIHREYDLWLSHPSVAGFVAHDILKKHDGSILRFTNFVEVLCPMFSLKPFLQLYHTWNLNYSSWGLDFLWPKLLGYPDNKIGIIDEVTVVHTRPLGQNNSRYPVDAGLELKALFAEYDLMWSFHTYSNVPK